MEYKNNRAYLWIDLQNQIHINDSNSKNLPLKNFIYVPSELVNIIHISNPAFAKLSNKNLESAVHFSLENILLDELKDNHIKILKHNNNGDIYVAVVNNDIYQKWQEKKNEIANKLAVNTDDLIITLDTAFIPKIKNCDFNKNIYAYKIDLIFEGYTDSYIVIEDDMQIYKVSANELETFTKSKDKQILQKSLAKDIAQIEKQDKNFYIESVINNSNTLALSSLPKNTKSKFINSKLYKKYFAWADNKAAIILIFLLVANLFIATKIINTAIQNYNFNQRISSTVSPVLQYEILDNFGKLLRSKIEEHKTKEVTKKNNAYNTRLLKALNDSFLFLRTELLENRLVIMEVELITATSTKNTENTLVYQLLARPELFTEQVIPEYYGFNSLKKKINKSLVYTLIHQEGEENATLIYKF